MRNSFGMLLSSILVISLNASTATATPLPYVDYKLQTTNLSGALISSVNVGEQFLLNVVVEDTRGTPSGVFAAYLDLLYDSGLVSLAGPIDRSGSPYVNGLSGDTSTAGLVDEAGGFDGATPLGGGEHLLFTLAFSAVNPGALSFSSNPADVLPFHATLVYGGNAGLSVDEINFGTASIKINGDSEVPEPATMALLGFGLFGAAARRRRFRN